MALYSIGGQGPHVAASAFVAPGASLIGHVELGERAGVWFGAVIRGDNAPIRIGDGSNIQEGAVLHVDPRVNETAGQRRFVRASRSISLQTSPWAIRRCFTVARSAKAL